MPPDPFEVLGIAADASLKEARAAYRRVVSLFHPDHLQGMRADVRAEGERRLREATEALDAIRSGYRGLVRTIRPPQEAATGGSSYNAQIRAVEPDDLHADWCGPHAAAMWRSMQRSCTPDGPVRQVEWGAYECTLKGSNLRRLLAAVLVPGDGWQAEPLEAVEMGGRRLVGTRAELEPGARDLGWLVDQVDDGIRYVVTAEMF